MKVLYFTRDYTPHDFRFLNAVCGNGDEVYYLRLETRNVYESRPLPEAVRIVDWAFGKEPFDMESAEDHAIAALREVFETIRPDEMDDYMEFQLPEGTDNVEINCFDAGSELISSKTLREGEYNYTVAYDIGGQFHGAKTMILMWPESEEE